MFRGRLPRFDDKDVALVQNPRRLWRRYLLALSLVLTLVVGGHLIQSPALRDGGDLAGIINESGRQRMLSQRILYLSFSYDTNRDAGTRAALEDAIDLFEASHGSILSFAAEIPEAAAHYAGAHGPGLDQMTREYIALARASIANGIASHTLTRHLQGLSALGRHELLESLDHAVSIFEAAARDRAASSARVQDVMTALAVLVLVIEGAFIFWPAQRIVNQSLDRLDRANSAMRSKSRELEDYARKLAFTAFNDPLTGLINRKKLHDELAGLLSGGDLGQRRICVMHVDLDGFKAVNDTLGHSAGDAVLKRVAEIMQARVRKGDLVARVGGDEFVIVMELRPDDARVRAEAVAQDLIRKIADPMRVLDVEAEVGASVGYTFATPDTADAEVLISNADVALYEAKRSGKGCARPFTGSMRAGLERRQQTIRDMEDALVSGAFVPYFQPQVSVETGAVIGFELLARWVHPERGLMTPGDFLPLAEEVGIIDAIDARLSLDGLDMLTSLHADGWPELTLSLNASTRTMRFADYPDRLEEAVVARGLSARHVVIEVLETTLISDTENQAARTIAALSGRGFPVHVDDFGTGYASLAHLSKLDVHGLKIDRSLISDVAAERTEQVVAAIIGLSDAMNLQVVAEGVESPAQFAALRRLGGHAAQGFGIAPPMSALEARRWLGAYGRENRTVRA